MSATRLTLSLTVLLTLTHVVRAAEPIPQIEILAAPSWELPRGTLSNGARASVDCNSPVEWDADGKMLVFTSHQQPYRSTGSNLFDLASPAQPVYIEPRADVRGGIWIEATYLAADGLLYGWYHNEPPNICGSSRLTAPRIGALVSTDKGLTWRNLGIILEAPAGSTYCDSQNYYFAGGNGDFSVILDQTNDYFYFFISTYHRQFNEQGVAVARMSFADRDDPVGRVWKWHNGAWNQPGRGGLVNPFFPALVDWHRTNANAYWGAAVHYNTYLNRYVMLLNRARDRNWTQEGVYIAFNENIEDPLGWSAPQRLELPPFITWYPELIGTQMGETDKSLGQSGRLFVSGYSEWKIVFHRSDNPPVEPLRAPMRRPPTEPRTMPTRGNP